MTKIDQARQTADAMRGQDIKTIALEIERKLSVGTFTEGAITPQTCGEAYYRSLSRSERQAFIDVWALRNGKFHRKLGTIRLITPTGEPERTAPLCASNA